ncbi:hypothetical protein RF11_13593 [Thelohanellus kitauei]|uniref:Uncharacterized protein n=1 Tax=Thelohanellus kitauei TaxID=669202 RepID=A0A0C2ILQ0_THEKT|nr:hypothetical protein RF11_13593 [Thelohanellus kitauei]
MKFRIEDWDVSVAFVAEFNASFTGFKPGVKDSYNFNSKEMGWERVRVSSQYISVTGYSDEGGVFTIDLPYTYVQGKRFIIPLLTLDFESNTVKKSKILIIQGKLREGYA